MHIGPLEFLTPLHMSVSDNKNTMSIDLWFTNIFQQVGGFANTESVSNEGGLCFHSLSGTGIWERLS